MIIPCPVLQWAYQSYATDTRSYVYYGKALGLAAGFLVGSFLSDYLGRRRIIYAGFLLMCVAQCGSGVSEFPVSFIVCQCVVGVGAGKTSFDLPLLCVVSVFFNGQLLSFKLTKIRANNESLVTRSRAQG